MELKTLNAKIKSIARKTAKWRDDVQLCLIGCTFHAFTHHNTDPMTRLVKALKGADIRAVIKWAETHSPCLWQKKEVSFKVNKSFKGEYDAVALMASPWWELATKAKDVSSTFDMMEALEAFITRMEREAKAEGKVIQHREVLDAIKAAKVTLVGKIADKALAEQD